MPDKQIDQTKVLLKFKGKYLLLKKVKDVHPEHIGGWEVPGGKIKKKEDKINAALREVKEETKLNCKIITELKTLELEKDNIKTKTHVYLAEAETDKVILSKEHSDYIWIFYKQIDELENVIYKDLLKNYLKEAEKIRN
ncbi:NUDIX hydrolase [Candidatus Woesearchaeota archaeon]|nr:NUDIX hydrolase [Candidatus Woesearchaeota archaeon]